MKPDLSCILNVLNGDPAGSQVINFLLEVKFDKTYEQFAKILLEKNFFADKIIDKFNSAPIIVQHRFIGSPELFRLLSSEKLLSNGIAYELYFLLSKLLIAEGKHNRVETECVLERQCKRFVSPFGDVLVTYANNLQWKLVETRKIGKTISLDFDSDLARQNDPSSVVFDLPCLQWSEEEKELVHKKLNCAISYIDIAAPEFGLLIRNFVRRIFLRKSLELGERKINEPILITSEYLPIYPGTIGISNTHCPENTVVMLMETILHESIHNLMACYEIAYGDFMSEDKTYRPVSPWSGNLIPNHSLAHAVFVYYACYILLENSVKLNIFNEQTELNEAKSRIESIAAGFLIDKPLTSLFLTDASGENINGLYDSIMKMQERVRSKYKNVVNRLAK